MTTHLKKQMSIAAFVDELLTQVPELSLLHQRHIEAHHGLVPVALMADVTRLMLRLMKDPAGAEPLTRLMRAMERALQSPDTGVRELVESSLVERLSTRSAELAERWLANDDLVTRP
ncbi:DUF7674 family protein [Rhizobacter sp. P5_C2]